MERDVGHERKRINKCEKWYRIILKNLPEAESLHNFFSDRCILHFFFEVGNQQKVAFRATIEQCDELRLAIKAF